MGNKHESFTDSEADAAAPPSFLEATSSEAGPLETSVPFQTRLACVSLHMNDRIRFLNFSTEEIRSLRDNLRTVWSIQDVRSYGGAEEFKFKDYPWLGKAKGNDQSRRLIKSMLQTLYNMGWVLQAAVDISKKIFDEDTMIFRYQDPPPPPCDWLSISFDWTDKMKIVDAPPSDLAEALVAEFTSNHRLKSHVLESTRLKLKFHSQPWQASGERTVQSRLLLLKLLEILERFGYSFYASVDQVNASEEADVLVVTRQQGWTPGMPVWHR